MPEPHGDRDWYQVACKAVSRVVIHNPVKSHDSYIHAEKERFKKAKAHFKSEEDRFVEVEKKYKRTDGKYIDAQNRYRRAEQAFEKARKRYQEDQPRKLLKFARLDLEPYEVTAFAIISLVALLIVFAAFDAFLLMPIDHADSDNDGFRDNDKNGNKIDDLLENLKPEYEYIKINTADGGGVEKVVVGYYGSPSMAKVCIYILAPTLLIPLGTFYFLATYPQRKANRIKVKNFGRMPEAISYMTISMRLNPSLNKAVEFASDNIDEPLSGDLKQVIWNVYMNKFNSIEESYLDFAYQWGEWNEDFKRALYAIRSAALERTDAGLKRVLDQANAIILEGTLNKVEAYLNSLSGPTMVLFSLGILLPMMIASMLPIMGLGMEYLPQVAVLMDVVIPLVTLLYAMNVLEKRPGTILPPDIPCPLTPGAKRGIATVCVLLGLGLIGSGVYATWYIFRFSSDETSNVIAFMASLPILWGIGLPIAIYLKLTSRDQKRELDMVRNMEEEFPDALFAIGSRIAEGKPYEHAIEKTSETMRGTHISNLLKKISYGVNVSHSNLRQILFGRKGVLVDYPSKNIKAMMLMVVESVKKDSLTAGQTIIEISKHQRELKRAEQRVQSELSKTINMMKATGMLFAPMIMGVTSALYFMLVSNLSKVSAIQTDGASFGMGFTLALENPIPPQYFSIIIGLYLILTVIVIGIYTSGIQHGEDWIRRKDFMGNAIPVALVVYSVSILLANLFLVQ